VTLGAMMPTAKEASQWFGIVIMLFIGPFYGITALIDEVFSKLDHTPLDKIHRQSLVQFIDEIDEILGLDLAESTPDITDDLKRLIIQRRQARAEKNWEESDRIRDELLQAGVAVRDTPSGSVWTWK
jgi:cysteinyl-tRNA synthetase